jgi:Glyoxalase-like domain
MPRSRRSRGVLQPADGVACGPRARRLVLGRRERERRLPPIVPAIAEPSPPTWPDPLSSMQLHLHFQVNDLDAAERTVLALGGTMFGDQPGDRSRVYADPAGRPFCLVPTRDRTE